MTWLNTDIKDLFFEDTSVGRLKKKIWEASDEEITQILNDYEIPSPSELGKPGTYIQNTIRKEVVENRKKNDILFLPIGCTELGNCLSETTFGAGAGTSTTQSAS